MEERPHRHPPRSLAPALSVVPQTAVAVAVAVGAHGQAALGAGYGALGVAAAATLLLLHRRPGPVVAIVGALELVAISLLPLPPAALLPVVVAVFRAAVAGARWWAAGTVAALLLVPLAELFVLDRPGAGRALGATLVLVGAFGAGSFRRARAQARSEEALRLADRQRIAVEQERVRIARELHDVLAHSLSSIAVQAGVGLHLAPDRPRAAVEALETIRDASRGALDEVRGVLGVLRGDEGAPLAPEPDLDAAPALVEELRRTGARVELADDLRPRPSRPVQLALYRIVQESLTNARRHAPGAAIEVRLRREGTEAVARVTTASGGVPAGVVPGNGITGMRERAAQLGGSLSVVVRDGGVAVEARIPLGGSGGPS